MKNPHLKNQHAIPKSTLPEISKVFLKLGFFAFGGPAAHIAMMEDEVVTKRQWVTKEQFIDMLGFTNLIPGPNSTEMAINLGYSRGGRLGLWLAGICFIMPAMVIVLAIAVFYQLYGSLPSVSHIIDGVKPVIIAVVAQALYQLAQTILKKADAALLAVAVMVASLLGIHEIPLLFIAGLIMLMIRLIQTRQSTRLHAVDPLSVGLIFLVFLKIGSVLYGSGYVLLAFIRTEFVERYSALTQQQLIDAIAVGQFTPGPVFTTATFIGYIIHGFPGAIVATIGIFLPSFLFVLFLRPLFEKMRSSRIISHILDGINAASIALMAAVTGQLGYAVLISIPAWIIFLISAVLLIRYKVNSTWLILGGGVVGYVLTLM